MDTMEDFENFECPPDDKLYTVARKAEELLEVRAHIADLQEEAAELARRERELSMMELPDLMKEIGIPEFKTESGARLSIQHKVKASISKARKEAAFKWLRENGHGSLIKERVVEENVHPNTLAAFCKEQLARGVPLPEKLLGIYEFDQTVIKV